MLDSKQRLRKNSEFQYVFKKGRPFFSRYFTFLVAENSLSMSRFGFVISNKVSKVAPERNRLKRQLREIVRKNMDKIIGGYDGVFLIKIFFGDLSAAEQEKEVMRVLNKAGMDKKKNKG